MGQSSSRSRRPDAPASSSSSSPSSSPAEYSIPNGDRNAHHPTASQTHPSNTPATPVSSPNTDRLRRPYIRRSMLNLFKPKTSRNRADSPSDHLGTSTRPSKFSTLRALRSRRFSSVPASASMPVSAQFPLEDQERLEPTSSPSMAPIPETQVALVGADAAESSSASSLLVPPTDANINSSNKGKEPELARNQHTAVVQQFRDNQPSSGSSSSTSTPSLGNELDHQPAINLAPTLEQAHESSHVDGWADSQRTPGVSSMSSDVMLGPSSSGLGINLDNTNRTITTSGPTTEQQYEPLQPPIEPTSIGAGTLPPSTAPQSNLLSSTPEFQLPQPHAQTSPTLVPPVRHVPPPGTLVVVQGVVHTTDVSRPSSSEQNNSVSPLSAPNPSTPSTGNIASSAAPVTLPMSSPTSHSPMASDRDRDRARNRLSALFGRSGSRPSSRSSAQVPSILEGSEPIDVDNGIAHEGETSTQGQAHQVVTETEAQNNATAPPPTDSSSLLSDSTVTDVTTPSADVGSRTEDINPRTTTTGPGRQTSERPNNPSLSPSSIDILGTLLSVAAAATAASLLTGSSEPILSSGLTPPTTNSTSSLPSHVSPSSVPPPNTIPSYSRPMHPPFRPTGINDMSPAGRAERMRQAWSTIRERLGLRPTPPQHNPHFPVAPSSPVPSSSFDSDSGSDSTIGGGSSSTSSTSTSTSVGRNQSLLDTREQMLAEMARAFNVGLGLGPNVGGDNGEEEIGIGVGIQGTENGGGVGASQGGGTRQNEQESELREGNGGESLPPEGSFERFLVELQADLRAALSQEGLNRQGGGNSQQVERAREGERESGRNSRNETEGSAGSNRPESSNSQVVDNNHNDDEGGNGMPELRSVNDSDSEYNNEGDEGAEDDFSSVTTSPSSPPRTSSLSNDEPLRPRPQGPSLGSSINASGSINWWRVYRFPPILPTRPPTSASTASASTSPTSTSAQPLSSNQREPSSSLQTDERVESPSRSNDSSGNSDGNTGQAENPNASVIIPVIIVGLQSVNNPGWRPTMLTEGLEGGIPGDAGVGEVPFGESHPFQPQNRSHSMAIVDEDAGMGVSEGTRSRRPRRWSSRATSALRNLRPGSSGIGTTVGNGYDHGTGGRNRGAEGQQDGSGPGSRTFLIYVIGGYYPPDHNIVTGGPDRLETFEALLELVEFLTNVKSPTATKEEIEKSGLEVIKPLQLEQYERDGKISSNCTERCLICLDDYEEQDEIRVMTCRHGFHKGCVDKWLQTGKNNCPACRSKGVSSANPTAPTPRSASTS